MTDIRSYILPSVLAVGFHALIVILASNTWFEREDEARIQPFKHIKAELIDLKSQKIVVDKKNAELKKQQAAKRKAEAKRKAKEKAKQKKLANEKKRKLDQKKAAEKKKKDKVAKAKAEKKRQLKAKQKADLKRKKDKAIAKKKADAKKLAVEKKRKAEADKKKKQELAARKAAEAKRKKAEQQKRQQEQERIAREQAVEQELAREQQARAMVAQDKSAKASAISVITSAVSSNWRRPPSARNGMVVQVRIHLLPTGEVDDAYTVKSSGDEAFDRSAVNAVLKAERFPELQNIDPIVFDRNLRNITLKFRPEDLRL